MGSLKRDILLEAFADLGYVGHIHRCFADADDAAAAAREALERTVELISELTAKVPSLMQNSIGTRQRELVRKSFGSRES